MKAYELLSKPENWTTVKYARDKFGRAVNSGDPDAICWCAEGAIKKCYHTYEEQLIQSNKIRDRVGHVPSWNDAEERTHDEVVTLLKELDI